MTYALVLSCLHAAARAGALLPNSTTTMPLEDIGGVQKGGYSDWSEVRMPLEITCCV